jgi:hypothetical protein
MSCNDVLNNNMSFIENNLPILPQPSEISFTSRHNEQTRVSKLKVYVVDSLINSFSKEKSGSGSAQKK